MRAQRILVLSPRVTAARAFAWPASALAKTSRSKPDPWMVRPLKCTRRRNASRFLSMTTTEWPSSESCIASPDPTRPQPTTTICTGPSHHSWSRNRNFQADLRLRSMVVIVSEADKQLAKNSPVLTSHANLASVYPESLGYRLKRILLGRPFVTEQLSGERLNRILALGVLAPDCISSSAYGTEEILTQMTPFIGLAAFALVVPVMFVIIGVLFFVTMSYLDVIKYYTTAGGSYVVARDNFGPKVAQIAAVALLIDYTVTVAVQVSAGTAALTSAIPRLGHLDLIITVGVVLILIYGNLRGLREAGSYFALPTYFYVV